MHLLCGELEFCRGEPPSLLLAGQEVTVVEFNLLQATAQVAGDHVPDTVHLRQRTEVRRVSEE